MDKNIIGGKAWGLEQIKLAGDYTPNWVVLDISHFEEFTKQLPKDVLNKLYSYRLWNDKIGGIIKLIQQKLKNSTIPDKTLTFVEKNFGRIKHQHGVAIRSSMISEDDEHHSYAGIFKSILFVKTYNKCIDAIKSVWISSFSEQAIKYALLNNINLREIKMGIIMQEMINPDYSGVLFSRDPITGENRQIINAIRGCSEKLVSGEVSGETIVIEDKNISSSKIISTNSLKLLLNSCKSLEIYFNYPLDIEWAVTKGKIYILQVRGVTSIIKDLTLWDNSNIIESFYGKTTPLTYSVAQTAYYYVYKQFCEIVGVPKTIIEKRDDIFKNMIGYIDNKIYYNLSNWYRLLYLLPFKNKTGSYMENMMGVKKKYLLDENRKGWNYYQKLYQYFRIITNWLTIKSQVKKFHKNFEFLYGKYSKIDFEALSSRELIHIYEDIRKNIIETWKAPIINDFLCMTFYGVLKNMTEKNFGKRSKEIYQQLLTTNYITSTKPVESLKKMSSLYKNDELHLTSKKISEKEVVRILISRPEGNPLGDAFKDFLSQFGDRSAHEQKMEYSTYRDNPEQVISLLKSYTLIVNSKDKSKNISIKDFEINGRFNRMVFKWVVNRARKHMIYRENMRICRTQIFGTLRLLFRALGKSIVKDRKLSKFKDIYFLDIDEIKQIIAERHTDFSQIIKERRLLYEKDQSETPDRFFTNSKGDKIISSFLEDESNSELNGIGCSPGIATGEVIILKELETNKKLANKIIVAERTEPSWAVLLPLCKGILVERGSVLSHSGIIARELGIPAIIGIKNLTRKLKNGERIYMDGSRGIIKLLKKSPR